MPLRENITIKSKNRIIELLINYIKPNQVIAVDSSPIAKAFLLALALKNEEEQMNLRVVPTSHNVTHLVTELGFQTASLNEKEIDVAIELADSIDHQFNYTKLNSTSLVRDKMIAMSALELIVACETPEYKERLNRNITMEVVEFGLKKTMIHLEALGEVSLLKKDEKPCITESGNYLVKVLVDGVYSLEDIEIQAKNIPGVIETGLFIGYADRVILLDTGRFVVKSRLIAEDDEDEEEDVFIRKL